MSRQSLLYRVGFVLSAVLAARAASAVDAVTITVPPWCYECRIADKSLPGFDAGSGLGVITFEPPVHGTLTRQDAEFVYAPDDGFWSLRTDAFAFTTATRRVAVVLVAGTLAETAAQDFEPLPPGAPWPPPTDPEGRLEVSLRGALRGQRGLLVFKGWTEAYLEYVTPSSLRDRPLGNGQAGSGTGTTIRVPPDCEGCDGEAGSSGDVVLVAAGPGCGGPDEVRLRLTAEEGRYALVVEGAHGSTEPVPIARGSRRLDLEWWSKTAADASGGFRLKVDERVVASVGRLDNAGAGLWRHRFGAAEPPASDGIGLVMDDISIRQGDVVPGAQPILVKSLTDGGLRIPPDGGRPWLDRTPTAESRLGLRVRLSLEQAPQEDVLLLAASSHDDPAQGSDLAWLELRPRSGRASLVAAARHGGEVRYTDGTPLPDGPFVVEIQWKAAGSLRASDGLLRIWVDGVPAGELTGLANQGQRIESLRLDRGTGEPVIRVDHFHTWR